MDVFGPLHEVAAVSVLTLPGDVSGVVRGFASASKLQRRRRRGVPDEVGPWRRLVAVHSGSETSLNRFSQNVTFLEKR